MKRKIQQTAIAFLIGAIALATLASAQTVRRPVLVISQERLFAESALGRAILSEESTSESILLAEAKSIEAELIAEELALTNARPDMPLAEFQIAAELFDQKVEAIRAQQEEKDRNLIAVRERHRRSFLVASLPVIEQLMRGYGASVIVDQRNVMIFENAAEITDEAIVLLDNLYLDQPQVLEQILAIEGEEEDTE